MNPQNKNQRSSSGEQSAPGTTRQDSDKQTGGQGSDQGSSSGRSSGQTGPSAPGGSSDQSSGEGSGSPERSESGRDVEPSRQGDGESDTEPET